MIQVSKHISKLDVFKQEYRFLFSCKIIKVGHPSVTFDNAPVAREISQKQLEVLLGNKPNFDEHFTKVLLT